jgi:hypothetical protein
MGAPRLPFDQENGHAEQVRALLFSLVVFPFRTVMFLLVMTVWVLILPFRIVLAILTPSSRREVWKMVTAEPRRTRRRRRKF